MKIPKYIREKMHRIAKFHGMAIEEMNNVENWLENKGLDVEDLRRGDGYSLEELDYGNDVTDIFCGRIESGELGTFRKGK